MQQVNISIFGFAIVLNVAKKGVLFFHDLFHFPDRIFHLCKTEATIRSMVLGERTIIQQGKGRSATWNAVVSDNGQTRT